MVYTQRVTIVFEILGEILDSVVEIFIDFGFVKGNNFKQNVILFKNTKLGFKFKLLFVINFHKLLANNLFN